MTSLKTSIQNLYFALEFDGEFLVVSLLYCKNDEMMVNPAYIIKAVLKDLGAERVVFKHEKAKDLFETERFDLSRKSDESIRKRLTEWDGLLMPFFAKIIADYETAESVIDNIVKLS